MSYRTQLFIAARDNSRENCLFLSWINMIFEDFVLAEIHIILHSFRKLTFWLLSHNIYDFIHKCLLYLLCESFCLATMKTAKWLSSEILRAHINNYFFFRIRLFSSKMITVGYTVCRTDPGTVTDVWTVQNNRGAATIWSGRGLS